MPRFLQLLPRLLLHSRYYSTTLANDPKTKIHIPRSNIYAFGSGSHSTPVLSGVEWVVKEGEAWAVVDSGEGGKRVLFNTLLGKLRITPPPPPPGGLFPFLTLASQTDPLDKLAIVSFTQRRQSGGEFYDYTARYGAVRDEDRITLRQSMFPQYVKEVAPSPFAEEDRVRGIRREEEVEVEVPEEERKVFEELMRKMELERLLDLPLVALSNGQMRRARIVKAILRRPELLLLDEPLTGLDKHTRPLLLSLLHHLHSARSPRIILGLRTQDTIPEWITNLALVRGGRVLAGPRGEVEKEVGNGSKAVFVSADLMKGKEEGEVVVKLDGVNVKYGPRVVLKDINWTLRQGDRWHLQGANGSGKTTLLSLLTGDHPQSFIQKGLYLPSYSAPSTSSPPLLLRRKIPTPHLARLISTFSPEQFDAFPRKHPGMSVWEAIATGFEGGFVPKGEYGLGEMFELDGVEREQERERRRGRMWSVLEALAPGQQRMRANAEAFAKLHFSSLPTSQQRLTLLARALVAQAPVVVLDEVWSGMDKGTVECVRRYLRDGAFVDEQVVIVVSHYEEEVPWSVEEGVKRFVLEGGEGREV